MAPRRVLLVFAKEPRAGHVKTRLTPPLTPDQAARCQRAFLEDSLARFASVDAEVRLVAAPRNASPWLEALAARLDVELDWQGEGNLGSRMETAMRSRCVSGAAVAVVGSDSPDLPLSYVTQAFAELSEPGTVIGPCDDGGYYLVGASGDVPPIFELEAQWGGPAVLCETLERLAADGRRYAVLPWWHDVDDYPSLRRLALRLRATSATGRSPSLTATMRVIETLAVEGVEL